MYSSEFKLENANLRNLGFSEKFAYLLNKLSLNYFNMQFKKVVNN